MCNLEGLIREDWREPRRGQALGHGIGNDRVLAGVVLAAFATRYLIFP